MMTDVRVTLFGDSMVAGVADPAGLGWVGHLVAAAFAMQLSVTAYNLGVRRDTSADVLARWQTELEPRLSAEADCRVVFSFGANDTTYQDGRPRVDAAASVENLELALAGARRRSLPVLVVGPPPINDDAQQERISELSSAFREVAARRDIPYVDIADALRSSREWRRELDDGDGAHPGRSGYALIAGLVVRPWLDWLSTAPAEIGSPQRAAGDAGG